jgi:hypothetical protein
MQVDLLEYLEEVVRGREEDDESSSNSKLEKICGDEKSECEGSECEESEGEKDQ